MARLPRIFLEQRLAQAESLFISNQPFIHLIKVLRLKKGQTFIAFDGTGIDFIYRLENIEKRQCKAVFIRSIRVDKESPLQIFLYQALSKSDHMDWTIQKATELGVTQIIPFYSERSQNRMKPAQRLKKQQHWQKIVRSACEQCGRSSLPLISPVMDFETLQQQLKNQADIYLLHLSESSISLNTIPPNTQKIHLVCGAEGGFSEHEINIFTTLGARLVKLGPRVLRTETAATAALAILQNLLGDMG